MFGILREFLITYTTRRNNMAAKKKMPMVKKNGKKIPAFAADGKGKMAKGGMMKKKGYAKGGMKKKKGYAKGGVSKSKKK
jgi:hypothetical protein